jgi:multidrug efflux pump subunit AcrA (membrane-fusion protein)
VGWDVRAQAVQAFLELWMNQQMRALLDRQLATLDRMKDAAKARYVAGLMMGHHDFLRAQAELAVMQAEKASLDSEREALAAMLNSLRGRPLDEPLGQVVLPGREPLPDLESLLARLEQRPELRAAAIVQPDETREAHVHSKLMGWVQELFVNAVGQPVKRGQPLYSLYSQELLVAQQEYLRAKATNAELAAAARAWLRLWDIPEDQVKRMERDGPQKAIVFRSPIDGTVIDKQVLTGHYVEPEMLLYRIADLSRVWVVADVYEFEVNRLDREGLARVEVQGVAEPVQARVDYVYPTVDPVSRTVKVRLVVPNPQGALRPGSFATVELPTQATDALWVPEEAVVDTGTRQVVYVALGQGRFRPTLVKVGRRAGNHVEVREGLSRLPAGAWLRAEAPEGGAGERGAAGAGHRVVLLEARLGVHAATGRGLPALHACDAAQHLHRRGQGGAPAPGPHHQVLPRGGDGAGQGGPRGDGDGPGAALHVRDGHHPQAALRVARGDDAREAGGRADAGAGATRPPERAHHAHPGPGGHAHHRHPHSGGREDLR